MATSKQVRVDLFIIDFEHNASKVTLVDIFTKIANLNLTQRIMRLGGADGHHFCLYEIKEDANNIYGMIGRIREDLLDPKGNLDGDLEPLDWADDEGQVQLNYFIFHKSTAVLAIPFQLAGIRENRLVEYLNHFAPDETIIISDAVLRKETINDLLTRASRIVEVDLRYKIPSDRKILRDSGLANDEIIAYAGQYAAGKIQIILKPDKLIKEGKPTLTNIKGFLKNVLGHKDIVSGQLKVFYGDDNEKPDLLKLSDMTVYVKLPIYIDKKARMLSKDDAFVKLAKVIDDKMDQIIANRGR